MKRLAIALLGACSTHAPPTAVDASSDGTLQTDAATDAALDAAPDASPFVCNSDFAAIPNGQSGHKYKLLAQIAPWETHRAACLAQSSYLAIPDTTSEAQAIYSAVVQVEAWVGIDDQSTEGMFVDSKGATFTGAISQNSQATDCVLISDLAVLVAIGCTNNQQAVCECDR